MKSAHLFEKSMTLESPKSTFYLNTINSFHFNFAIVSQSEPVSVVYVLQPIKMNIHVSSLLRHDDLLPGLKIGLSFTIIKRRR
jgi:hypothetical protein